MHVSHKKIVASFKKQKGKSTAFSESDSYLLSGHSYYSISVPVRRILAKQWLKENSGMSVEESLAVMDSLYTGDSHEEKTFSSILLGYSLTMRKALSLKRLDAWLDHLVGWAEIDSLCSGTFSGSEVLEKWDEWKKFILKLSKDKNINKRRAALVFLIAPLRTSGGKESKKTKNKADGNSKKEKEVLDFALGIVDALKSEKPILITKAVSWLLRSGVQDHKKEILAYVEANQSTLPKIAVRETLRKIKTGRK